MQNNNQIEKGLEKMLYYVNQKNLYQQEGKKLNTISPKHNQYLFLNHS